MKKWIAFMLILVLGLGLYGCNGDNDDGGNGEDDPKTVTPRQVEISGNPVSMDIGETKQLTATVTPEDAPQDVRWSSSDDSIATVDEDGLVLAVGEGTVNITATSTVNTRANRSVSIIITRPISYEDATGIEVSGTVKEFRKNSFIQLTATVFPVATEDSDGAEQSVIWSSLDESIAVVDDRGRVTGLELGETTIVAAVASNPELTDSFDIKVIEYTGGVRPEDPTGITITGDLFVNEGWSTLLMATVQPAGVSQNVTWTSSDESIATVNELGVVTGVSPGTVYIQAASNVDLTVTRLYEMTVRPLVPEKDPNNLGGYEILIMAAPHATHEHDPYLEKYEGQDQDVKIEAWEAAEAKHNAKLKVVPFPESAPWGTPRINWIIERAQLNDSQTDIFVSTTDWVAQFAQAGATLDVLEFYEEFGKNSMSPAVRNSSSYQGGLYALPTNDFGAVRPYHGLVFNVALLEELDLENPSALFNNDEWTWPRFEEYVRDVASKLADGQTVLSGKQAGLYYGMASAAGVSLVDPIAMETNFLNPYVIEAANLVQDINAIENMWGDSAWDAENPSFNSGNSLFQVAEYWFIKDDGRFSVDMWGDDTRYGMVPFPYPDNMSKHDTRVSYQGGAIYQMAAGRQYPAGVTAEDVYRVFADMMIGTTRRLQEDPTIDEGVLIRRAVERRVDDPDSVNAISFFRADKVIYDTFYTTIGTWQGAGPMIDAVAGGADYIQVVDEYNPLFMAGLDEIFGG